MWDRYTNTEEEIMQELAEARIQGTATKRFFLETTVDQIGRIDVSTDWDDGHYTVATLETLAEVEKFIENLNNAVEDDQVEDFIVTEIQEEQERQAAFHAPKAARR